MSSSRSTEQRSHCSRVSARCMIFLTIFSRSVCSSNRSLTTSSSACGDHDGALEKRRLFSRETCGCRLLPDSSRTLCETLKTAWRWKLIFHRKVGTSAAPEPKMEEGRGKKRTESTRADMRGTRKRNENVPEEAERFDSALSETPLMKTKSTRLKCQNAPHSIKGFLYSQPLRGSEADAVFTELYLDL